MKLFSFVLTYSAGGLCLAYGLMAIVCGLFAAHFWWVGNVVEQARAFGFLKDGVRHSFFFYLLLFWMTHEDTD